MAASNDKEILNYSINLDEPVGWKSTSTLWEVQDKTRWEVKKHLTEREEYWKEQDKIYLDRSLRLHKLQIILQELETHVKIVDTVETKKQIWKVEMMWQTWKKVYIDLPPYKNFEWFKFSFFVSDLPRRRDNFDKDPKFREKSYSMKDISKLLQAMNRYMAEHELIQDWDINYDYENELKHWETGKYYCDAWSCLKHIIWIDDDNKNKIYWLSDEPFSYNGETQPAFVWDCEGKMCHFRKTVSDKERAYFFRRLPD